MSSAAVVIGALRVKVKIILDQCLLVHGSLKKGSIIRSHCGLNQPEIKLAQVVLSTISLTNPRHFSLNLLFKF